jgi:F0F1-type ATP synthase assembly protein I
VKPNNTNPPDNRKKKEQWETLARYSGLGVEMAFAVLGSAFLGQYIDKRMGNDQPVFTLILSFLGVFYVFYRIFKVSSN